MGCLGVVVLFAYHSAIEIDLLFSVVETNLVSSNFADELNFIKYAPGARFSFSAGYGPAFWYPLSIIVEWVNHEFSIASIRLFYIFLKYLTVVGVFVYLFFRRKPWGAVGFLLAVTVTPGFLFFGKVISPEYELILWSVISAICLIESKGGLNYWFALSLFFVIMATFTKLVALPIIPLMLVYGLILFIRDKGQSVSLLQFLLFIFVPLVPWFAAMAWDGERILKDFRDAFSIIPALDITFENLKFSWIRKEVTWDQIQVTGLYSGFLPAVVVIILLIPVAIESNRKESLLFLLAGTFLAINMIAHQMGFSWYLFLSGALIFVALGNLLDETPFGYRLLILCSLAFTFLFVGRIQIGEQIAFKKDVNAQIYANKISLATGISRLESLYPCVSSSMLDVLIPSLTTSARGVIPARTALELRSLGQGVTTDVVVLNRKVENQRGVSPLIEFAVKDDFSKYRLLLKEGDLDFYILKEIEGKCFV